MQHRDLIPVRMLVQYRFCPRNAYLESVSQEWASNREVAEGKAVHKRVDREPSRKEDLSEAGTHRSVMMSSSRLGIIGKIDLMEITTAENQEVPDNRPVAVPVEYKRGRPRNPTESQHLVQIGAQMMILEENGYRVKEGILYYAGAKKRVTVELTPEIRDLVTDTVERVRELMSMDRPPEPLIHDPRCFKCSLAPLCLPDELNFLKSQDEKVRRLAPLRDNAVPLYVQEQGARVSVRDGRVIVRDRDGNERVRARLMDVSHVALFGGVQITSQALQRLASEEIPVIFYSYGGWFRALATNTFGSNILLKLAQYRSYHDDEARLLAARAIVSMKLHNSRQLLMRNRCTESEVVERLKIYEQDARKAESLEELLGIEGNGAREYFRGLASLLAEHGSRFDFKSRNRRPPRDPVNAVLSFGYALLLKDILVAVRTVGLEEGVGLYHEVRPGRPAMALDLMEEFRALIVDSVALYLFDSGQLGEDDFVFGPQSCGLNASGRKKVISAYEHRVDTAVRHPVFGYRLSYRRVFELQARLFARYLLGEMDEYVPFRIR